MEDEMDDRAFDQMTKVLSATPTRRHTLALVAGLFAEMIRSDESAVFGKGQGKGKRKGKEKGKGKKKRKDRDGPKGEFCGDRYCEPNQRCCGGGCNEPSRCCTRNSECNPCELCSPLGLCEPNPAKNGTACRGCLECINGACGIPNDDFCPEDHQCRGESGGCCATCLENGQCCPATSACINPGLLSNNFCCHTAGNTPCGDNGDGTFRECCSNFNEECVAGECVPKPSCEGDLTALGQCCPPEKFSCGEQCCDIETEACSVEGCCGLTEDQTVCDDYCVNTKTDENHCGRCNRRCAANQTCCDGKCVDTQTDWRNCGGCGTTCDIVRTACSQGSCQDICSLNTEYTVACDDGTDYWCCPERSPRCCRMSGQPHCC
jgi:hypothetical protein